MREGCRKAVLYSYDSYRCGFFSSLNELSSEVCFLFTVGFRADALHIGVYLGGEECVWDFFVDSDIP